VGLEYRSDWRNPSEFLETDTSRKFMVFCDRSEVNFMVAWEWLRYDMNSSSFSSE
jgi:hypothetical protein